MPKKLEDKLFREARIKFPKNKTRQNSYVFGALRDIGWKPRKQRRGGKHKRK